MIKAFKTWLETRKQKQLEQVFRDGYGWAWTAHMIQDYSFETIRAMVYCSVPEDDRDEAFDNGAKEALSDMEALLKNNPQLGYTTRHGTNA